MSCNWHPALNIGQPIRECSVQCPVHGSYSNVKAHTQMIMRTSHSSPIADELWCWCSFMTDDGFMCSVILKKCLFLTMSCNGTLYWIAGVPSENVLYLGGPNIASEVYNREYANARICGSEKWRKPLANFLRQPHFIVWDNSDLTTHEVMGGLKNVYAIGAGEFFDCLARHFKTRDVRRHFNMLRDQ